MKIFNAFFGLLLSLLLFGCTSESELDEKRNDYSIEIYDSIEIDYQGMLNIVDYCSDRGLYLALDQSRDNKTIVIFDDLGKVIHLINNANNGPSQFRGDLSSLKFNSTCDGYILLSQEGLYRYSLDGDLENYIQDRLSGGRILPADYHLTDLTGKDSTFISSHKSPSFGLTFLEKAFYENVKMFSVVETKKDTFYSAIGFEDISTYKRNNRLFPPPLAFSAYDKSEKLLYLAYSADENLYSYKYDSSLVFSNQIPLNLDYFKIKEENYLGENLNAFEFALDSRIEGVLFKDETLFISYVIGIDHEKFLGQGLEYNGNQEYQKFLLANYQYAINILDDGAKKGTDLILPDTLSKPMLAYSKNQLLVGLNKFKIENQNEIFYKLKIKQNEKTN